VRLCLRPKVREVQRVRLEPDDVVVLKLQDKLTRDGLERILADVKRAFPDNRVAVLEDDMALTVWGKAKVDGWYG
jgi:hypothetical protein